MREDADYVLEFVRGSDVACPTCGYNLRDLQVPRCPECGGAPRLRVVLAEPRLRLWLTMTIPMLAAAGTGLLFVVLIARKGFPGRVPGIAAVLCFVLAIPVAAAMLLLRRRFARASLGTRSALAIASLASVVTLFVVGVLVIR